MRTPYTLSIRFLLCVLLSASAGSPASPASAKVESRGTLQIYFIDVEGGQSTLIVTPEHHSLLSTPAGRAMERDSSRATRTRPAMPTGSLPPRAMQG